MAFKTDTPMTPHCLTLTLTEPVHADLIRLATLAHCEPTVLANRILAQGIAVEAFESARQSLRPFAEQAGYYRDEDLFAAYA